MADQGSQTKLWTPANIVTLIRICLVPVFVVALLSPWPLWFGFHESLTDPIKSFVAAGIFILISCTDWIDGYLARSRNEVTDFGKFVDPLADKILVTAALLALIELGVLPSWPVLIILTREFIVAGIRMLAANRGVVIAASWYGKAKTVTQIIAIILFILKDGLKFSSFTAAFSNPLYLISWIVMVIALVLTILSMLDYISKAKFIFKPSNTESDQSDLLAQEVIEIALEKKVRLGTAESLTGGLIAAELTSIPGSSAVVAGGIVSYQFKAKEDLLQVDKALLDTQGAVNKETALSMAKGALKKLSADVVVAVTGIAGPGGAEEGKPVGTVWFALVASDYCETLCCHFDGNRSSVREQTVTQALKLFKNYLSL